MEYYTAIEQWNNSNMDGPRDYHTKWSKPETNIIYHLKVESKKMIQMNLFLKQKLTHRLRKKTYGYQRGRGEG